MRSNKCTQAPWLWDRTPSKAIFAHTRVGTRIHVRLNAGTSFRRLGFLQGRTEKTYDQAQNPKRRRYSFRRHRCPGFRSGWWLIRAGQPVRFGTAAAAAPKQKLFSRSGFRTALPGTALRLERRQGQVEGRRPGALIPAVRKLAGTLNRDFDYWLCGLF